jgi:hypothetical protein
MNIYQSHDELILKMFDILFSKIRLLLKNPMSLFVYGIMSKWFIAIFISSMVVVFWVFKGLEGAGVLKVAEDVVFTALKDTKSIARYCIPKIAKPEQLWQCIQSPPEYKETEDEKNLQNVLDDLTKTKENQTNKLVNPYEMP